VIDLLRKYGPEYIRQRGAKASLTERRVLAELSACRTPLLGSHTFECDTCGHRHEACNSCRNRHCPLCGGPARARWLERMLGDALPVPYFHLVFTVPHALSTLIQANRRALFTLLFRSAWAALRDLAADPQYLGAHVGAVMVLHTWGQNLQFHPHVHAVVPGGGLSEDGTRWVPSRSPKYFLPYQALSRLFRDKFLSGLRRLYGQRSEAQPKKQGQTEEGLARPGEGHRPARKPRLKPRLKLRGKLASLAEPEAWEQFLAPLAEQDWVVHLQAAPAGCEGPQAVLKYLARYVRGAAISDRRLLSHEDGRVTFRAKDYRQGRKRKKVTLSGVQFVQRWMQHVLPPGFVRVRYYGLLANADRTARLARCRELAAAGGTDASPPTSAPTSAPTSPPTSAPTSAPVKPAAERAFPCPRCQVGQLRLIYRDDPPSWREILDRSPYTDRWLSPRREVATSPARAVPPEDTS